MAQPPIPNDLKPWIEGRKRFGLSHALIQMARELGCNPRKLGKLDNHRQEPWKQPLPAFIATLYKKRFGFHQPAVVRSIEEIAAARHNKKQARKTRQAAERASADVPDGLQAGGRHDGGPRGVLLLIILILLAMAPLARAQEQRVLNVYNWTDYIDPAALQRFEKETGVKVNYDVYDSLETLEAKLLTGHSGYDIVVPSDEPSFSRLIRAGALAPIDHASVPNWHNLDPALMRASRARRSRQRAWCDLPVRQHRPGHRTRQDPRAGAGCAARQLGPAVQAGECPAPRAMRHRHAGFGNRRHPVGAALSRQEPRQHRCRRPRRGGTRADAHSPLHPQFRLRRHAGGAGGRRGVPGAGLFRRRRAGGGARGRGPSRRDRAVRRAEGGRADRLRHAGDSRRRAAPGHRADSSSTSCCSRT